MLNLLRVYSLAVLLPLTGCLFYSLRICSWWNLHWNVLAWNGVALFHVWFVQML